MWAGLKKLPEIWRFPYNIYAMAEAIDFNLVYSLRFLRPIIKLHIKQKVCGAFGLGCSQNLGFPIIYMQRMKL